jgi:hypothetical protein
MPLPKDKENINLEQLDQALMSAAVIDKEIANTCSFRIKEIDVLEDEIIATANSSNLKLSMNPSLLDCIQVQTAGQGILNRVTEVELQSIRIVTKIKAKREVVTNNVLNALGSSGSAESRRAKASSAVEVMNLLATLEEGLLLICETIRKNVKSSIDVASRAQTAIQHEVQYLDGSEIAQELINATRGKFQ